MESQIRGRSDFFLPSSQSSQVGKNRAERNFLSVLTEIIQANDYAFSLFLCDYLKHAINFLGSNLQQEPRESWFSQ